MRNLALVDWFEVPRWVGSTSQQLPPRGVCSLTFVCKKKDQSTENTSAFFWWPLQDNRPSDIPGPVPGTLDKTAMLLSNFDRKRPAYSRDRSQLVAATGPNLSGTVPVCPENHSSPNVFCLCLSVSLCCSLAFFCLPLFHFLFSVSLSLSLLLFSHFLPCLFFASFWFLVFVSFFPFLMFLGFSLPDSLNALAVLAEDPDADCPILPSVEVHNEVGNSHLSSQAFVMHEYHLGRNCKTIPWNNYFWRVPKGGYCEGGKSQ